MNEKIIQIYTDGSCHTRLKIGSWVSIIFIDGEKTVLRDIAPDTTHNRMELMAVIRAVEFIKSLNVGFERIEIYSDSQYVVNIAERKTKLKLNYYLTKNGEPIQNSDLIQALIRQIETESLHFIKVPAHEKKTGTMNYNREADMLARKLMREYLRNA